MLSWIWAGMNLVLVLLLLWLSGMLSNSQKMLSNSEKMLSNSEKKVKCFENNAEINEATNQAIKTKPENASIYIAIADIIKFNCTK